ncbi:MAG: hypothetical protein LRS48_01985 [Desulfurococcales archaeon]|nr:hypothetical protein [Desulfurococcales archaeon]
MEPEAWDCVEERVAEESHVAEHLADRGELVVSTPCMILYMEQAARRCLDSKTGRPSVGYRVDFKHRKPVRPGERLVLKARVFEFDGRRALVYVKILGPEGVLVGEGINERYVR